MPRGRASAAYGRAYEGSISVNELPENGSRGNVSESEEIVGAVEGGLQAVALSRGGHYYAVGHGYRVFNLHVVEKGPYPGFDSCRLVYADLYILGPPHSSDGLRCRLWRDSPLRLPA